MTPALGTIKAEAAACRAAWAAAPEATHAWHCHHNQVVEPIIEPVEHRIRYILTAKPRREQALRLRLFRPVRDAASVADAGRVRDAALADAWRLYDAAVAEPRRLYDAAVADAWRLYDAALAEPWRLYDAALAEPWRLYGAALADAGRVRDAALADAWRLYDAAVADAWRLYDAAVADLHAAECPNCPWDGTTIFPEERRS